MRWNNKELITNSDYCTALASITTISEGDFFMEEVLEENPDASENIGYLIGYLSAEDRSRLYDLLKVSHPIFGKRDVSAEEAFQLGQHFANDIIGGNEAGLRFIGVNSKDEMELEVSVNEHRGSVFISRNGWSALSRQFDLGIGKTSAERTAVNRAMMFLARARDKYSTAGNSQKQAQAELFEAMQEYTQLPAEYLQLGSWNCANSITGECYYNIGEGISDDECLVCGMPDDRQ